MNTSSLGLMLFGLGAVTGSLAGCRAPQDTAPWNRDARPAAARPAPAPVARPDAGASVRTSRPDRETARSTDPGPTRDLGPGAPRRASRANGTSPSPDASSADPAAPPPPARTATDLARPLRGLLDTTIDEARTEGDMPSVVVGLVRGQDLVYTRVVGYADLASERPATVETVYNIGSITKVFTTTLLGVLRDKGLVQLDDAASRYLPAHVRLPTDPRGDRAISLRHLATHTSGLPGEPDNLVGPPEDPWSGYTTDQLYRALGEARLLAPVGAEVAYSNLGMSLLGHLLARAAGGNYVALMRLELLEPLGMSSTAFRIRPEMRPRYATGYLVGEPSAEATRPDLGALAPAGGLASTVADLARFVSLQFRAGEAGIVPVSGGTLAEAQRPQRMYDESWTVAIGLGWFVDLDLELGPVVRHNGGLGGHRCHVSFSPRHDVGVIVLSNRGWRTNENPVARLGRRLLELAVHELVEVGPEVSAAAEALADQLRTGPDDRLPDLFHPAFLQRMPLDRLDRILHARRLAGVRCTGIESIVPTGDPGAARVVYRMERGEPLGLVLAVDPRPPHQIVSLLLEPTSRPAGERTVRDDEGRAAAARPNRRQR